MRSRLLLSAVLAMSVQSERITKHEYVAHLIRRLRELHKFVEQQERIRDNEELRTVRKYSPEIFLDVGEYCLVKRPPEVKVSNRFQHKNLNAGYQIVEFNSDGPEAGTHTLPDLRVNREGSDFPQPVVLEKWIPIEILSLAVLSQADASTCLNA